LIKEKMINFSLSKQLIPNRSTITFFVIVLLLGFLSCGKSNQDAGLKADFSFTNIDDNHVEFSNLSEGDYYSLTWNFGKGETETTTDKKKTYKVYYPTAGDYDVSLKLSGYTGETATTNKTVSIANSDLELSFTAVPDPENPNYITLTNTSTGSFDSFKWIYREREVENEMEHIAYFPLAGTYTVELVVTKNSNEYTETKNIVIASDDPDYIENFTLVWSDEFDGNSVDLNNWTFETGASGWGNNELQNYTNGDNAEIVDGKLIITAEKIDDNTQPGSYTSTRIVTRGKQEFQYGRMEIRAKLPSGTGIWPAIWMLGSNINSVGWPACGEMDIMEYVGYEPDVVHSTVHTSAGSGGQGSGSSMTLTTCEEEFHVYGLYWTEEKLVFYADNIDNVIHTYNPENKDDANWPFNQPAFFILNIAVGGNWGGAQGIDNSIFPQTMEIDYVRVYQETIQ